MNILVTGATGFIGHYVVSDLLKKGHVVTAVARNREKAETFPWFKDITFIKCDIHDPLSNPVPAIGLPDVVIHLVWPNLTDYRSLSHVAETLPADYRFLSALLLAGVKHLVVAGTCFEYGLQCGCLEEDIQTSPVTPYAIAKDSLRRFLVAHQHTFPFRLQWARIFYPYGKGQKSNSLLAQLNAAIDRGEEVFHMSGGEQLRDYLPVEEVAANLVRLAETPSFDGVLNICSGRPVSVRRLVEEHLTKRNSSIKLNLGYYPYPEHEPMAFWGSTRKMCQLESQLHR